jgi:metallo-beta-lactamase family protein
MKITFYGGAETTTGSMHILEVAGAKFLIDCGMYQGSRKKAFEINKNFPFDPASLETVILSHAHIDHCGNLPNLHEQGYEEKIFCTHATRDLASVMLKDAAYIQMKDAEYLRKHEKQVLGPLYDIVAAEKTIWHFASVNYHQKFRIHPQVKVEFFDAGHILGAALTKFYVEQDGKNVEIVYAVDLGRKNLPILRDPESVGTADYLIIESTYGGRHHTDITKAADLVAEAINRTAQRGGKLIVPAFSLERTQELVYVIRALKKDKRIPNLPVYIDSPLAVNVTDVFRLHPECFDHETNKLLEQDEDPFGSGECTYVRSTDASKRLNMLHGPLIIISASGMCEAGRILHHLANNCGDPKNTILMVGYQAEGTLGRRILEGARDIKIFGDIFKLNAEVIELDTFSAHADETDLVNYVAALNPKPKMTFLVHGEPEARGAFQKALKQATGIDGILPAHGQSFELNV